MDFEDVLKTFLKILDVSGTEMELRAWDVERHPYSQRNFEWLFLKA